VNVEIPNALIDLGLSSRFKAIHGGRGSAKSHTVMRLAVARAWEKPRRVLVTREIQKSIRDSTKQLIDDVIVKMGFGGFFHSTKTEIVGPDGRLFAFAGLRTNPQSLQSAEGFDIAIVEEAATISERSLDILIPTIRKPGSEIWFVWNPRFEKDPVDKMFRGEAGPPPRSIVKGVNYYDNPWFDQDTELKELMEWHKRTNPEKYRHIWLGDYIKHSEARVFHNFKIEEFDTPPNARFFFGADWGFSDDPTTLVRLFFEGRTMYIDREAYKIGCRIEKIPALFDTIENGMARRWPIRADSSRPDTIDYLKRHGYPNIVPAKKGAGSVEEGVEWMKNYDIVIHPRCTQTADEFMFYSYKVDKQTNDVLPVLEDADNHIIDPVRYATEQLRSGGAYTLANVG
jgi:phage terminase large subunit